MLKVNKFFCAIILLICSCIIFTGCWNYREVNDLGIIAGVAIDKNTDGTIYLTIEALNITGGKQSTYEPKFINASGYTIFEAVRNAITMEGKRFYWSHAKVVIISEEIAKEDIIKYMDFLFRDTEPRFDLWILISKEKTAREVLQSKGILNPIISYQIDETMRTQKSITEFPSVDLMEFLDGIFNKQESAVLPAVYLADQHGVVTSKVGGTAIFKHEKLAGFLNEDDSKYMLWLRNEVKGGLIIIKNAAGTKDNVSLEIFKSKSKIVPVIQEGVLKMRVEIDLNVSIGEITGSTDFISSSGKQKLIEAAEKQIEEEIKKSYIMVRDKYNTDVYGFARRVEMKMPYVWNQIKNNWNEFFKDLGIDINVTVKIKGSVDTKVPLKAGK